MVVQCLRDAKSIDDELITLPNAAGDPEPAVDELGVALIGRLDGAEHAEAVLPRVNVLRLARAQKDVEDVAGAREGATRAHLKDSGSSLVCLQDKGAFDDADWTKAAGLTQVISTGQNAAVAKGARPLAACDGDDFLVDPVFRARQLGVEGNGDAKVKLEGRHGEEQVGTGKVVERALGDFLDAP